MTTIGHTIEGGFLGITTEEIMPASQNMVISVGDQPVWMARLWMPIDEDTPLGIPVLMGWWETWPTEQWKVEAGVRGADSQQGSSWRHGRATHWMPLPPAPGV